MSEPSKTWEAIPGYSISEIEVLRIDLGSWHGYVTVDFRARNFMNGYGVGSALVSKKLYSGRGWRKELIKDAEEHLLKVMQDSSDKTRTY